MNEEQADLTAKLILAMIFIAICVLSIIAQSWIEPVREKARNFCESKGGISTSSFTYFFPPSEEAPYYLNCKIYSENRTWLESYEKHKGEYYLTKTTEQSTLSKEGDD